jgi:CelD/BcsL family acetyltransferase involved in cellulose biosynthesis
VRDPPLVLTEDLRLEPVGSLDELRAEWSELAEQVGDPFATWDWAAAWCRHLLGARPLYVLACRRPGGQLAGILPLYQAARRPLRVMRFVGAGPADRQGPICLPADRGAVARALRRALDDGLRSDVLLAERLPGEAGWSALLGGRLLRREASPLLSIDGRSFDELLRSRSANFRQQARARERRLGRRFDLRFRLADDQARLSDDFAALVALHAARWSAGGSEAFSGAARDFHADFAERALRNGWLRLWFLELDGRPAAAWYGFRYGGAEWFYQSGRDPQHDRDSVGFVLMTHTVREAAHDGIRTFHLLRGDDPYKARFAGADPGLETLAIGRGARGRAAAAAGALALAVPPGPRKLVRRLSVVRKITHHSEKL